MQWSRAFTIVGLTTLFVGLFAFTRHVQDASHARRSDLAVARHSRLVAYLAERALARGTSPACEHGHWLYTQGRKILTDQGRRWRGFGVEYRGPNTPAGLQRAAFVRLSAAPYFGDEPATKPSDLLALASAVDQLSADGQTYVLVGLAPMEPTWRWQAHLTAMVHALANRPYVMFDLALAAPGHDGEQASPDASLQQALALEMAEQLARVRQAELDLAAPAHLVAIDARALAVDGHHRHALDYVHVTQGVPLTEHNVVVLGRRPLYALRAAGALFLQPLRQRAASVQPAT